MSCLVGIQRHPMPNPYHNHYYTETDLRSDIMGVLMSDRGEKSTANPTPHLYSRPPPILSFLSGYPVIAKAQCDPGPYTHPIHVNTHIHVPTDT